MARRPSSPVALLLLVTSLGCATAARETAVPSPLSVMSPRTERQALLLLLADRRLFEPIVVREGLAGDEELRRLLALTLARLADPRGLDALLELLEDPTPAVRQTAAFGLGRLGEERGRGPLLRAVADPDREVGRQAVAAAAALGVPLREVADALAAAGGKELWPRLVPHLHRFPVDQRGELELLALGEVGAELRSWAAYALIQAGRPQQLDLLRSFLRDEDPQIRVWSVQAIGEQGTREDLTRLRTILDDGEDQVVVAGLAAGRTLVDRGVVAPSGEWRNRIVQLVEDPRRPVRAAALEAAGSWLLDDELGAILAERAKDEDRTKRRERERALLALVRGGDPRAEELLAFAVTAGDPSVRSAAALGAGALGNAALLGRLRDDPDPQVRATVLSQELDLVVRAGGELAELRQLLERGFRSSMTAVRLAALEFLIATPVLPVADLVTVASDGGVHFVRVQLAMVRALEARASRVPDEELAVEEQLRLMARDRLFVVRQTAVRALEGRGVEGPVLGPVQTGRSVAVYQEILSRAWSDVSVRVVTEIGGFTIHLSCREAPLSCVSFRQLAAQGFYDGLPFFSVTRGALAQAGRDPGGGPGYFVRDEVSARSFDRFGLMGLVGEAADGISSEFFLTLSPQPQLDAAATFLGTVVEGQEVLSELLQGDRILTIRENLP